MKNVLFITIASGQYYNKYVENLYDSMMKHIKLDFDLLCLTDNNDNKDTKYIKKYMPALPWPFNTLMRYFYILQHKSMIKNYKYVFYIDSDMLISSSIADDILGESVCVLHPGFYGKDKQEFSYEKNIISTAYLNENQKHLYYQGCFQGGTVKNFLKMIEVLSTNIQKDLNNNYIAEWHDESHLNWYRFFNPPTLTLSPKYSMPQKWIGIKRKIIEIDKQTICEEMYEDDILINTECNDIETPTYNINYECFTPKIIHLHKNHKKIRNIK